jgi:hypothetical protein
VFAGAQRIGREVRAGAVVLAWSHTADGHAVRAGALGIANVEIGEHAFRADVRQLKRLLPPELAAKLALPGLQGHLRRFALA